MRDNEGRRVGRWDGEGNGRGIERCGESNDGVSGRGVAKPGQGVRGRGGGKRVVPEVSGKEVSGKEVGK